VISENLLLFFSLERDGEHACLVTLVGGVGGETITIYYIPLQNFLPIKNVKE